MMSTLHRLLRRPIGAEPLTIRDESLADVQAIRDVNRAAFSGDLEADLVERLRAEGFVIRSRLAIDRGQIVGHILFSPVWIEGSAQPSTLASLAPMSVLPDYQRQGIGSALVVDGIELCRRDGWRGVIVVGWPEYYPRFGFSTEVVAHLESPYAGPAFMGLELVPGAITELRGSIRYPPAFPLAS